MLGRKRIFVIEDEATITNSLQLVFSHEGYEARIANSSDHAANLASEWTPYLAIVDVHLKEVNGVELAIQLREDCPTCEVVLFTGFSDLSESLARARYAGHEFEIISKPIHPTEMVKLVAGWLSIPGAPGLEIAST